MNSFFDDVYGHEEYAYGKMPNEYLKEKLRDLKPGKILFPAEGEGRNAVYAAKSGWDVFVLILVQMAVIKQSNWLMKKG